ncbi:LON peptidase substrate-binding domain-containing protein [Fibrella aquatica]|uniref:LON peptidase substrate-binding domain-containing protein n=1 Tax=Fibrella aquatica TaxID=3242487 RepID=UPI00351F93C0
MNNLIPLFPLSLVVYPGEDLNLHIFEPRYRQLVNECIDEEKTFGVPVFIDNKLPGYGTEVHVTTLHKRYEDGRMDVKTKGLRLFKIVDFLNPVPGKLYAGGSVEFLDPEEVATVTTTYLIPLLSRLQRLYDLLQIETDYDPDKSPLFSYRIAHKVGLSVEQEYEMLLLKTEAERQQFLIEHLDKVIPVVADMERTKDRIKMNGHFKNLDPLTF